MNNNRKRNQIVIIALLLLFFIGCIVALSGSHKSKKPASNGVAVEVPSQITQVATRYLQAEQNQVGAQQTSPSSWLSGVQSITTAQFFASIQPVANNSTGSTSYPYQIAHQYGYNVQAEITNCSWDGDAPKTITGLTAAVIICAVNDTVVDAQGNAVSGSTLPYGWTSIGQQSPSVLSLSLQKATWLVSGEPSAGQTE